MGQLVSLTDLIAPSFYDVHHAVKEKRYTHHFLHGGRGSTKSTFVSIEIVKGIMADPLANAMVLRKVGDTLRDSVYEQYQWAIEKLGVSHLWHASVAPMRLIYRPTGQQIRFRGADNPRKIKSAKFMNGYLRFLHYEELDEFGAMEDIRSMNQSLIRGGPDIQAFYTFNPPRSQGNWVNKEVDQQKLRADTLVHDSDYTTVPSEWLGPDFIRDAEHLKKVNYPRYAHEYLGVVTGTGAEVFTNLTQRVITNDEIKTFDKIYRGLDFGYAADPLHYGEMYYDSTRKRLYIFDEIHLIGLGNTKLVEMLKKRNPENALITADSAEPRTINELNGEGLRVKGAKKGKGSVDHGVKWLSDLEEIIIDPERCPNTAREFSGYEIERDSHGNLKGTYPDKDNHSVDMARYALEEHIARIKWLV